MAQRAEGSAWVSTGSLLYGLAIPPLELEFMTLSTLNQCSILTEYCSIE